MSSPTETSLSCRPRTFEFCQGSQLSPTASTQQNSLTNAGQSTPPSFPPRNKSDTSRDFPFWVAEPASAGAAAAEELLPLRCRRPPPAGGLGCVLPALPLQTHALLSSHSLFMVTAFVSASHNFCLSAEQAILWS